MVDNRSGADGAPRNRAMSLRATAVLGVVAAVLAELVVPGLRGSASESVIRPLEQVGHGLSGAFWVALIIALVHGAFAVARLPKLGHGTRLGTVGGAGVVVALSLIAFRTRLPSFLSLVIAGVAAAIALAGALASLRAPHTRAVAVILAVLAAASALRLVAWEVASVAGERVSTSLYAVSRGVASFAVVAEGMGQLFAAVWLGTRARVTGQLLASAAICTAFIVTWGAAQGSHAGAAPWQSVLHSALSDAPGVPPPLGLTAFATFLAPCGVLLALVAAVQPRQLGAVVGALGLALLARGGYDVPLRALAVTTATLWLLVTARDERAMWELLRASSGAPRAAAAA